MKFGGVARYIYEMYHRLKMSNDFRVTMPLLFSENIYIREMGSLPPLNRFENLIPRFILLRRLTKILNKAAFLYQIVFKKYDLVITSTYDPYFLPFFKGKILVTIYDMNRELLPHFYKSNIDLIWKKRILDSADFIVTISETTKQDLLRFYPEIPQDSIKTIHLAATLTQGKCKINLPDRYVLFTGVRISYKNFNRFFHAMANLLKEDEGLKLLCIGGGVFTRGEEQMIHETGLGGQVINHQFSDFELYEIYSHALAFVYPSEYEGFGIPILEAMGSGCPALLSDISVFKEVAGNAAYFFNPEDEADIRRAIVDVIDNESLRKELIQKGFERSALFNWDKTYDELSKFIISRSFGKVKREHCS